MGESPSGGSDGASGSSGGRSGCDAWPSPPVAAAAPPCPSSWRSATAVRIEQQLRGVPRHAASPSRATKCRCLHCADDQRLQTIPLAPLRPTPLSLLRPSGSTTPAGGDTILRINDHKICRQRAMKLGDRSSEVEPNRIDMRPAVRPSLSTSPTDRPPPRRFAAGSRWPRRCCTCPRDVMRCDRDQLCLAPLSASGRSGSPSN